jgi:hypothetical protein
MPKLSPEEIRKLKAAEKKATFWETLRRALFMLVIASLKNGRESRRR